MPGWEAALVRRHQDARPYQSNHETIAHAAQEKYPDLVKLYYNTIDSTGVLAASIDGTAPDQSHRIKKEPGRRATSKKSQAVKVERATPKPTWMLVADERDPPSHSAASISAKAVDPPKRSPLKAESGTNPSGPRAVPPHKPMTTPALPHMLPVCLHLSSIHRRFGRTTVRAMTMWWASPVLIRPPPRQNPPANPMVVTLSHRGI